jgi:TM2 domain-containing membrane protein YozV
MDTAGAENRRLKALGLAVLGLAVPSFMWLDAHRGQAGGTVTTPIVALFLLHAAISANGVLLGGQLLASGFGLKRPWRDPRYRRALLLKLFAANVLVPLLLYSLLIDEGPQAAALESSPWYLPISVLVAAGVLGAVALVRRSWRHETLLAADVLARDARPPVLYLRAFRDDDQALLDDHGLPLLEHGARAVFWRTPEQELAVLLQRIGPVVAIGKPGEPLPALGAARLYVEHADWQREVGALMQRAALVVLRVGNSPGVVWEIEQALTQIPRQRLLLILLGAGGTAPEVASRLAPVLGAALVRASPPAPTRARLARLFFRPDPRLGSVVCFGPDGLPQIEPIYRVPVPWHNTRAWRDMLPSLWLRPTAGPLRVTMRRVFGHLQQPFDDHTRPRSRTVAVWLALLIGGTGAHCFYLGRRRSGWLRLLCLPLAVPIFMAWFDGLRMVWMTRAEFAQWQQRATPPQPPL